MMKEEGCNERGHVQVVRNTIFLLADRHRELLADPQESIYNVAYHKALPFIVELRSKGNGKMKSELETALDALYGITLLRMQDKAIGQETAAAISAISNLLNMLSEKYNQPQA
jgi:flagellin-specific chaperone FliS